MPPSRSIDTHPPAPHPHHMRLHRSMAFWSGLLVLGFLAWAWRDSMLQSNYFAFGLAGRVNYLGTFAGQFNYLHLPASPAYPVKTRVIREPLDAIDRAHPFIAPAFTATEEGGLFTRTVAIWVVMLALIPPWLGLIYWRYRRYRPAPAALET